MLVCLNMSGFTSVSDRGCTLSLSSSSGKVSISSSKESLSSEILLPLPDTVNSLLLLETDMADLDLRYDPTDEFPSTWICNVKLPFYSFSLNDDPIEDSLLETLFSSQFSSLIGMNYWA